MKWSTLVTTLLLFIVTPLFSQNWLPISPNEKYHFQNDTVDFISNTLWVDSLNIENGDSIFYLNRIVTACDTCTLINSYDRFMLANQGQFLQKQMIKKPTGEFLFTGQDTFSLYPQALEGEVWNFNENIEATIMSTATVNIFGIEDSTKVITLSNGGEIILSKQHGMLSFTENSDARIYDLIGLENVNLGEQLPNYLDFYTYEVGDVFQYSKSNGSVAGATLIKEKITILEKEDNGNYISYLMRKISRTEVYASGGVLSDAYSNETEVSKDYGNYDDHYLNFYPHQFISITPFIGSLGQDTITFLTVSRDEDENYIKGIGKQNEDYYFFRVTEDNPELLFSGEFYENFRYDEFYKENNGLVSLYSQDFEYFYQEELIGTVKNGDTLGIICPDELILPTQTIEQKDLIQIFPNPSDGSLRLMLSERFTEDVLVQVFDSNLKKVRNYEIKKGALVLEINLKSQSSGTYFLQLMQEGKILTTEKFIVQ